MLVTRCNSRIIKISLSNLSIALSKSDPQPEPENLNRLKAEVLRRWPMTSLLDEPLDFGFLDLDGLGGLHRANRARKSFASG